MYFLKLEDNCFTMLCWFLLYISINQPQGYMCPSVLNFPARLSFLKVMVLQISWDSVLASKERNALLFNFFGDVWSFCDIFKCE